MLGDGDGGIQECNAARFFSVGKRPRLEHAKTAHEETAHAAANIIVVDWSMSRFLILAYCVLVRQSVPAYTNMLPLFFFVCHCPPPLAHLCHVQRPRNKLTQGIVEVQGQSDS
jgi:hypothetical protein